MASTTSPKAKQDTFEPPRMLMKSEFASLLHDMQESSKWMEAELERRYPQRNQTNSRSTASRKDKDSTTGLER